jgi:pyruvate/2-oxoglutarate dehydrogenase complex dihydrolipoamide dehydrogenase (E3) component
VEHEATPELVAKVKPDVVIVASGAEPPVPNIPGMKVDNVVSAHDVLAGKVFVQCGNVLVLGGGMVGLEIAEFLASPGDNPVIGRTAVTIVEMLDNVGVDIVPEGRTLLMQRLRESGVNILTCTKVKEILEDGVVTVNTIKETLRDGTVVIKDGQVQQTICGMDAIILALGAKSVDELSQKIKDKVAEVYVIGDAKQPRKALEAIAEGAEVERKI